MRSWQKLQHHFWRSISRRGYVWFLLAVGTTFGSMGFLLDLVNIDAPFSTTLYRTVFCAAIAIGWFVSMTVALRLLPIVIALQFAGGWFLSGPAHHPPFAAFAGLPLEQRLSFDATGALFCIVIGYACFVMFAGNEGRQWVAVDAEMRLARNIHQALVPRIERTDRTHRIPRLLRPQRPRRRRPRRRGDATRRTLAWLSGRCVWTWGLVGIADGDGQERHAHAQQRLAAVTVAGERSRIS